MAYELIYTSAERGLKPGTHGFCTVACTRGMPPQTMQLLEAMSAYKNLYGVHEASNGAEPIAWSHVISNLVGRKVSVLSRVGATSPDHTGRSNKLAHHVVLSAMEHPVGGPAWLSSQPGFFMDSWEGAPRYIDGQKVVPKEDFNAGPAVAWEAVTGNAAYAALLPKLYLENPEGIVTLVYAAGTDMLPLIAESIALLDAARRWRVTYNTYFVSQAAGSTCAWRCCVADSEAHREALRVRRGTVIDLTGALPPVPEGELAERARSGVSESAVVPEAPRKPSNFVLMSNRNINQLNLKPRIK